MQLLIERLAELVKKDAYHSKRQRNLSQFDRQDIVEHLIEEIGEVIQDAKHGRDPTEELADVFICWFHLAIKLGTSLEAIEAVALAKLRKVFG